MARTQVQAELIATNAISGTIIADNAITATHIATNSISGTLVQDGGIVTTMIANNNVTATKIVTDAIQTRHIADDQVTAAKLANSINTDIATGVAALPKAGGTMTGNIAHASDFTLDVGGDIILDADGADVLFKDGGTQFGRIGKGGASDLIINASIADKDIIFSGTDGSTAIDALVLDMSANGQLLGIANTPTNPTYSFAGDTNTGVTRPTGDTLSLVTGGTERMRLTGTGGLELGYNGAGRQQANSEAFSIITPASGGGQGLAFKRLDSNNDQSLGQISWSNNTQDGLGKIRGKTIGATNSLGILFETADAGTLAVRCGVRPEGQFIAGNTALSMPSYPGTVTAHRTGDTSATDLNTWSFNATANGYDRDYGYKASGTGSYAYGVINTGETTWMSRLDFSGAIHLTNTTVQNISDRRLKKDIVDANSQWDDIKGLKFKNFKWKDETRGTDTYLGLIADEVESVSPGLVGIDAVTAETMPEDGIDPEYKNVKYSIVWMKAVKALQEAQARIETLEAEVKVLKEG